MDVGGPEHGFQGPSHLHNGIHRKSCQHVQNKPTSHLSKQNFTLPQSC